MTQKSILKNADELSEASKKRKAANPSYLRFVTAKSGPGVEIKQIVESREAAINEHLEDFFKEVVAPLKKRVELLESELSEARELKYCGCWQRAVYNKGNFVTDRGSLWVCKSGTDTRPGSDDNWQLCVKGGR